VTVHVDLRDGLTINLAGYGSGVTGLAGGGGAVGAAIAAKVLSLSGFALAAPLAGGAAIVGLAALFAVGPLYRWEMRRAVAELEGILAAVDAGIRSLDVFGEMPAAPPAIPRRSSSDGSFGAF
jgi:hypothetical protein